MCCVDKRKEVCWEYLFEDAFSMGLCIAFDAFENVVMALKPQEQRKQNISRRLDQWSVVSSWFKSRTSCGTILVCTKELHCRF